MKTLKKTLCLVLAVVMALGVLVLPASAAEAEKTEDADLTAALKVLKDIGVIVGSDENQDADEDGILTRAEVAAIVYRIMTGDIAELEEKDDGTKVAKDGSGLYASAAEFYTDVDEIPAWAKGYVGFLTKQNIFGGDENGNFNAEDPVTYAQLAKVMLCCIGYGKMEGEFSGADWETEVLTKAADVNLFGTVTDVAASEKHYAVKDEDGEVVKGDDPAIRGNVFKVVYNAALKTPRVSYFAGAYSMYNTDAARPSVPNSGVGVKNTSLIEYTAGKDKGDPTYSVNNWGMPTTEWSATTDTWSFNNPVVQITRSQVHTAKKPVDVDTPLYDSYTNEKAINGKEDACDIYTIMAANTTDAATKALIKTDNKIKVIRDNVVMTDDTITIKLNDEDTMYGEPGVHTMIFKNTGSDAATYPFVMVQIDTFLAEVTAASTGATGDKNGHDLESAEDGNLRVYAAASGVNSNKDIYMALAATEDDIGDRYAVTVRYDTTAKKWVADADPTLTGENAVENMYEPTAKAVKVDAVHEAKDMAKSDGFVGSDEKDYFYSANLVLDDQKLIDTSMIGEAVTAYVDAQGYVLYYETNAAVAGLAIVKEATVVKVKKGYVIDVDAYGTNGELLDEYLTFGQFPTGDAFVDETDAQRIADTYLTTGALIAYSDEVTGSYLIITSSCGGYNDAPYTVNTNYEIDEVVPGQVAFVDGNDDQQFLVNDETKFLVAQYKINTITSRKDDYRFVGYELVKDFRDLHTLGVESGAFITDIGNKEKVFVQAVVVDDKGGVSPAKAGQFADFVVINFATKQYDKKNTNNVDDYAFVYGLNKTTYADRYVFNAFVNGKAQKLTVALNAGNFDKTDLNKLYTFANENNNGTGYSDFAPVDTMIKAGNVVYKEDGVIYDTENDIYYALSKTCKVYTVAPTPGDISKELSLHYLKIYSEKTEKTDNRKDMWFELDANGYVSVVYINLDSKPAPEPTKPTEPSKPESATVGVTVYYNGDMTTVDGDGIWIRYSVDPDAKNVKASEIIGAIEAKLNRFFGDYGWTATVSLTNGAYKATLKNGENATAETKHIAPGYPVYYVKDGVDYLTGSLADGGYALSLFVKDALDELGVKYDETARFRVEWDKVGQIGPELGVTATMTGGSNIVTKYLKIYPAEGGKEEQRTEIASGEKVTVNPGETLVVTGNVAGTVEVAPGGTLKVDGVIAAEGVVTVNEGASLEAESLAKGAEVKVEKGGELTVKNGVDGTVTAAEGATVKVEGNVDDNGTVTAGKGSTVTVTGDVDGTVTAKGEGTKVEIAGDINGKVEVDNHVNVTVDGDINGKLTVSATMPARMALMAIAAQPAITVTVGHDVAEKATVEILGDAEVVLEVKGAIKGTVTVGKKATLKADTIAQGANVTVDRTSKVEVKHWNEAIDVDTSSSGKVVAEGDGKNYSKLAVGVYENNGSDLDTNGQTNHKYFLTYKVPLGTALTKDTLVVVAFTVNGKTYYDAGEGTPNCLGTPKTELAQYLGEENDNYVLATIGRFCLTEGTIPDMPAVEVGQYVEIRIFMTNGTSADDYESKKVEGGLLFEGGFTYDGTQECPKCK